MKAPYTISIYLDTRSTKKDGKHPVKLRVYIKEQKKQKYFGTEYNFTKKEFDSIWNVSKPRLEHKETRRELLSMQLHAEEVASKIDPFTIQEFDKKINRNKGVGICIDYHYEQLINELIKKERIGTASSYNLSRNSLKSYYQGDFNTLSFLEINADWLRDYEFFMTNNGKSISTVGIYLRGLRAIFNRAIEFGEIERKYYPFGKRKYQIPASNGTNKSLDQEQMATLFKANPINKEQEKAKDFWFFSYACNGMNIKDILLLKNKDVSNDKIVFIRAKTKLTSRAEIKPLSVFINDYSQRILDKYRSKDDNKDSYVFPILTKELNPTQRQNKIKNFTRFINQHIKELAIQNKLPKDISTYWARHSFTTNAVRNGKPLEFIQESLGHNDINTTKRYFAGFDDKERKEFSKSLMDF